MLVAFAVTAFAAVTLSPQNADASTTQAPRVPSALSAGQLGETLAAQLKGAAAGSYYDSATQQLIVNITDRAVAGLVRAAGARPRAVRFAQAELNAAKATLDSSEEIPGTTWVSDPRVNRVVVTADPTVTGAKLARLKEIAGSAGETVVVKRTTTKLTRFISGGDAIYGRDFSARCSLGFNVKRAGKPDAFLTAGHCGNPVKSWAETQGGPEFAHVPAGGSSFPGDDYAIAEYTTAVPHPSEVNLYNGGAQAITGARDAALGEAVQRSGSTTGPRLGHVSQGTVTGLNATATYKEGRVTGLIKTNVCAEPGDSGGPLFSGANALGLTSGGDGDCNGGPATTFYQPVTEPLAAYGATLG
ncbi:S1 family peptidase [Streptomyces sp. ISL-11]|uniref:S1 family peptidase n=1 Tax=Streptomyces sp. ISL-11 TaxID=2819174 RepID=UPI001BEAB014|nr:S1 family peptidase [Streptomyces sp. ISL-11]MBT2387035.1 S1 family peptidase [Streptomyces sp. ISL-11]